ncbi:MAG: BlaI/MecI/CopY family transcriptional regulator [Candidatus Marinimicrobia bacterium]|nr:BlaI/MecI/CopY family transcriptional regulator [Candidatus Neomarinimicrobiota bacterium]
MPTKTKLTPVEWEIMEAIWDLGGSPSVREVLENKFTDRKRAYTTVQTIMNTLMVKGMLSRKKIGLVNFYRPTKPRQSMVKSEVGSMISRVFKGSAPALANYLIDSENLTLAEIDDIKNLLTAKEKQLRESKND